MGGRGLWSRDREGAEYVGRGATKIYEEYLGSKAEVRVEGA